MSGSETNRSRGLGRRRRSGGGSGLDFELNLASIIDCFVVLIAFVLVSASFVAIGILDSGVATASAAADPNQAVSIVISLKADRSILVSVKAQDRPGVDRDTRIASLKADWNLAALGDNLGALKTKWPAVQAATLVADNAVQYREVVRAMETTRRQFPAVLLGGF